MKRLTMIVALSLSALAAACGGGADPGKQCETIYQKGDGTAPYKTDKAVFIAACKKAGAATRKCLLEGGEAAFKDKACAAGNGDTFRQQMELMKLGQGG